MIIAVDFDETIAYHELAIWTKEVPEACRWLAKFTDAGAQLILDSLRSGLLLEHAIDFCRGRYVKFWGVNENPVQRLWTSSPKPYADLYIDNLAFGCPLIANPAGFGLACVDWKIVGPRVLSLCKP